MADRCVANSWPRRPLRSKAGSAEFRGSPRLSKASGMREVFNTAISLIASSLMRRTRRRTASFSPVSSWSLDIFRPQSQRRKGANFLFHTLVPYGTRNWRVRIFVSIETKIRVCSMVHAANIAASWAAAPPVSLESRGRKLSPPATPTAWHRGRESAPAASAARILASGWRFLGLGRAAAAQHQA